MAYPEIMKMLFKIPAVKAAGILVHAGFYGHLMFHIQADNCADFLPLSKILYFWFSLNAP